MAAPVLDIIDVGSMGCVLIYLTVHVAPSLPETKNYKGRLHNINWHHCILS
jgi:hypothetical protein